MFDDSVMHLQNNNLDWFSHKYSDGIFAYLFFFYQK